MSRKTKKYVSKSHLGASGESLAQFVFESHGWSVGKLDVDTGIDRYVLPINEQGFSDGSIFGAQVKTGTSFLESPIVDGGQNIGWWFSESGRKFDQWLSSKIPVIIVLCEPSTEKLFWALVKDSNVIRTGKSSKIAVYKVNELRTDETFQQLYEIAQTAGVLAQEYIEFWGMREVYPQDMWRYSILVPKLLSTQIAQGRQWISAQEAAALLVRGQLSRLLMYSRKPFWNGNKGSDHWVQGYSDEIELLVKLAKFLRVNIDMGGVITLPGPSEPGKLAIGVILQALEAVSYPERLEILTEAVDEFDNIVERDWIRLQLALTLMEMGEVEEARGHAHSICLELAEYPRDMTALAISLGAQSLMFHTGVISYEGVDVHIQRFTNSIFLWQEQLTTVVDNILLNKHFDSWSQSSTIRWGTGNVSALATIVYFTQLLRGDVASLKMACDELGTKMIPLEIDPILSTRMLIEAGKHDKLREAIARYANGGEIEKLFPLLDVVDLTYINRRTIHAELVVLQSLGVYLDEARATTVVDRIIELFYEPGNRLAYPFFNIEEELMITVASLYLTVNTEKRFSTREFLLDSIRGDESGDQIRANAFARSLGRIPEEDWAESQMEELAILAAKAHWEAKRAIEIFLSSVNSSYKNEIVKGLPDNYGWALASFGIEEKLQVETAEKIIGRCGSHLEKIVENASKGSYSGPGFDHQGILIHLNITHPEVADWKSLLDFCKAPPVSPDYIRHAMRILQDEWQRIPRAIRIKLGETLVGYFEKLQKGFFFSANEHTTDMCVSEVFTTGFILLGNQPSVEEKLNFSAASPYRRLALVLIDNELNPDTALDNCIRVMASSDSVVKSRILALLPGYFARTSDRGFLELIQICMERMGEAAYSILSNSLWKLDNFPAEQALLARELQGSKSAVCRWKSDRVLSSNGR